MSLEIAISSLLNTGPGISRALHLLSDRTPHVMLDLHAGGTKRSGTASDCAGWTVKMLDDLKREMIARHLPNRL